MPRLNPTTKTSIREILKVAEDLALEQGKERLADQLGWLAARSEHDLDENDLWDRALGTEEREYREWVKDAAENLVDVTEGDHEDAIESVDELADSSQRVIYTHQAIKTVLASDNEDAWFEQDLGDLGDSFPEVMTRLAYAAVRQDLGEAVEEALDEYEEEHEED